MRKVGGEMWVQVLSGGRGEEEVSIALCGSTTVWAQTQWGGGGGYVLHTITAFLLPLALVSTNSYFQQ